MTKYDEQFPRIEEYLRRAGPIEIRPNMGFNPKGEELVKKQLEDAFKIEDLGECVRALLKATPNCSSHFKNGSRESPKLRRTVGDLYRIFMQYRPEVTLKQLYETLFDLTAKGLVYSTVCGGIRKRVYRANTEPEIRPFNKQYNTIDIHDDEFKIDIKDFLPPDRVSPERNVRWAGMLYEGETFKK